MVRLALLLTAFVLAPSARAEMLPGPYPAEILKVLDGDSFKARVRIWLDQDVVVIVRLADIDAAELDAPCPSARAQAVAARDYLEDKLKSGVVRLSAIRRDKFGGRIVAHADADGVDLAAALSEAGLVRPYRARRPDWCAFAGWP